LRLVEHDQVIDAFAPNRADEAALDVAIPPWWASCLGWSRISNLAPTANPENAPENSGSAAWPTFDRKRIDLLLKYPLATFTRHVSRDHRARESLPITGISSDGVAPATMCLWRGHWLIITVPPRHLKSTASVAFVAWLLRHDTSARRCVAMSPSHFETPAM